MPARPNRTPPARGAEIAVVTVTYGSSRVLGEFLDSVLADDGEPIDILVVDNASADADTSATIAAARGASFIRASANLGYGGAVNLAARTLGPDIRFVVIANPDVVCGPAAISGLVGVLRGDVTIGSVGPRILDADGGVYPSARRLPSLVSGAGHALFSTRWQGNPWSRRYRDEDRYGREQRDAGWLSGSFLVVRRDAFDAVGGFDERYFMYFEDVDLGARLAAAGWRNAYVPAVHVTHTGAHSTSASRASMIEAHHDSAYRFLSARYRGPWHAPTRLALRVGLALRRSLAIRRARAGRISSSA